MELVTALRARGCAFSVTGNRLRVSPWTALTTEEQAALRALREPIKRLVRAGLPDTSPPVAAVETGEPAAPVAALVKPFCTYCNRAVCATDPAVRRVLHLLDPEEIERRNAEATAVMLRQLGRESPYL